MKKMAFVGGSCLSNSLHRMVLECPGFDFLEDSGSLLIIFFC